MAVSNPEMKPGTSFTGYVALGNSITGARFVQNSSTQGPGKEFGVLTATTGSRVIGVASRDITPDSMQTIWSGPGLITDVTANGVINAGNDVTSDATGRAVAVPIASLLTGVVGSNNAIRWIARSSGLAGNAISVQLLASTGNSIALSIAVTGNSIVVTPATNGGGTVTTTAAQLITAIQANTAANSLVTVANETTSTGAAAIPTVAATNLSGGSGGRVAGVCMADTADGALAPIKLI